jgi:hypothetical protein
MRDILHLLVLLVVLLSSDGFSSQPKSPLQAFSAMFRPPSSPSRSTSELLEVDREIESCQGILSDAAITKASDPFIVVENLASLEKLMRKRQKLDDKTSQVTLAGLNGSWRLIFTTGTVDTQKKIGKINYFPLKAVQSFDTDSFDIENGIYIGDFPLIKFFGHFEVCFLLLILHYYMIEFC